MQADLKGVAMHVLPLPFGLALALLPRREVRLLRNDDDDDGPIRLPRESSYRERILADPTGAAYLRQFI
jgi:hypothetical protein